MGGNQSSFATKTAGRTTTTSTTKHTKTTSIGIDSSEVQMRQMRIDNLTIRLQGYYDDIVEMINGNTKYIQFASAKKEEMKNVYENAMLSKENAQMNIRSIHSYDRYFFELDAAHDILRSEKNSISYGISAAKQREADELARIAAAKELEAYNLLVSAYRDNPIDIPAGLPAQALGKFNKVTMPVTSFSTGYWPGKTNETWKHMVNSPEECAAECERLGDECRGFRYFPGSEANRCRLTNRTGGKIPMYNYTGEGTVAYLRNDQQAHCLPKFSSTMELESSCPYD